MLEYINCNLCAANQSKMLISLASSNIVQCKKCGLIYRNPRASKDVVLMNIMSDKAFTEHQKIVWYDSKIKLFNKNIRRIEKYFSGRRLLDVGCGYGTFLKLAQDRGWHVQGIELSESATKFAKEKLGLNIFKGTLRQANFSDNSFDVATLWEVLGQLTDPLAELMEVKRVLKEGGLLALRLHNAAFHVFIYRFLKMLGNIDKRLNIRPFVFHLYSFAPETIRKILEKAGFVDIRVCVSEFTTGDPYSTAGVLGKFGMQMIKKITFYFCQSIFYLTGGRLVLGPSILVFAKKPLIVRLKGNGKN